MIRSKKRIMGAAVLMTVLLLLAACSATGGRKAFLAAQNGGPERGRRARQYRALHGRDDHPREPG